MTLLPGILILVCCVGVWLPRFRRVAAPAGCVGILLVNAITRGYGHINHAEIGPLLVTGILTWFLWRLPKSQIAKPGNEPQPTASTGMVLATFCFAMTYCFVGIARLVYGGIELLAGETIPNAMLRMSHRDWLFDYNFSTLLITSPMFLLMLKLGTAAVTVFEIAAPFCLVSNRFRKLFLLFIPAFHLGAMLVFRINFLENVFTMLLFVNLTACLRYGDAVPRIFTRGTVPSGRIAAGR